MILTEAKKQFIVHWGEMGTRWGINRTVAQIHALLYIAPKPLNAEEIAGLLSVARSNVSASLKELQNWGIIKVVHVFGDRRDYFETLKDVWEMFMIIMDQRKSREIDPTVNLLKSCIDEIKKGEHPDKEAEKKLTAFLNFFETMTTWYGGVRKLPIGKVVKFVSAGKGK